GLAQDEATAVAVERARRAPGSLVVVRQHPRAREAGEEERGDRRVRAADQRDVELTGADLSGGRGHRVRAGGTPRAERDDRPRDPEIAGGHGRGRVRRGDEREGARHAAGTVLVEERAVILLDLHGAGRRAEEESGTR